MTFFDTNATRRRLMAGGFTEEQADTAVSVAADVAGQTLATRADLEHSLRDLEQRLTIRVGGMLTVAVAILVALERLAG